MLLDDQTIQDVIKEASKAPKYLPVKIKEDLTWQDVAKIEVNLPDLPGLIIDKGNVRNYPYSDATAHITGYVAAVSEAELKAQGDKEPVLSLPGFKIGKTGIEKQYEPLMRGKTGVAQIEVNVIGREVREVKEKRRHNGCACDVNDRC